MDYIYFYARKQQFRCLSNFSQHPITIQDEFSTRQYLTGEHCFHGEKYYLISQHISNSERKNQLLCYSNKFLESSNLDSPLLAKQAGGKKGLALNQKELDIWDELNVEVQRKICLWKIHKYPEIKEELLKTQNKCLIHPAIRVKEEKVKERKWEGRMIEINGEKKIIGQNMLGKIWMEIRDEIQS